MTKRHKIGTAAFLLISGGAAIAQIVNPQSAAQLTTEVWRSYGLVGLQSLALILVTGILGWLVQRLFSLVVQVVRAITEVKAALEEMVTALEKMPCAWLESRSRPPERHQSPSPFGDVKITSAETPT